MTTTETTTQTAPPPFPADLAPVEPLSARGLDALARLQSALAWELR